MIFLVINLFFALFLIYETISVEKKENVYEGGSNPVISNLMLMAINVCFFTLVISLQGKTTAMLFSTLVKFCFVLEGCMLLNMAFSLPYFAWKYTTSLTIFVKTLLQIGVLFLVMINFKNVRISDVNGIEINSAYIFSGLTRKYFPWTWVTLYNILLKYVIPSFMALVMLLQNERTATKLERYKGYIYVMALLSMWFLSFCLDLATRYVSAFSVLHYGIYIPMFVIFIYGAKMNSAPSGRSIVSFTVKSISLYFLPAVVMGGLFMFLYPLTQASKLVFIIATFVGAAAIVFVINSISLIISRSKLGHSSDYALAFEKALASIDYSGEMDDIAENMFQIFKQNAESSSMSVYINGGNDTFELAYASQKRSKQLVGFANLCRSLLNDGRNIVASFQIESDNNLVEYRSELKKFFAETKSDIFFILNEGRDVHGLILLGIKENNEHYKEYDLNVFKKLYSYFFVFGYYMRNISNKEIIGTVNRELRMSSQIITSIQDNIDILNNPKMDAGCIMVPAHNIGGEFVDMIRLTDTRHMFVVGDLSGKGIAASMNMVILKQIIRAYLSETHDFKQLVVKVNRFIRDNLQKGTIFEGMFAIVNFENDTMYYINCGIPAILLYTESYNNVIEIQGSGHILGFVKDISPYISIKQIKLNKNDIVLACTDGLIESHSLRGEKFGKERIQRYMVANAMYPAHRMAQFEYDELVKFMSHEMEDDVSVLVMKYLKSNASEKAEAEAMKAKMYDSLGNIDSEDAIKQFEKFENFVQNIEGSEEV
ncbi:MAG: serine/threonine-protein phosphatase [Treponema sp.]|nr:serine/threonine-protein phosphatase [Treponema sp.]